MSITYFEQISQFQYNFVKGLLCKDDRTNIVGFMHAYVFKYVLINKEILYLICFM